MPTDNLNSAVGGVALAALSRVRTQPDRLKHYFLTFLSLVVTLSVPMTIFCALFGTDVLVLMLGSKWETAGPIFRLLAPTVLVFACINPMYWLLVSLGLVQRSLRMALVIAPLVISAYLIGFRYGPQGVALSYSVAMSLWLFPHLVWSVRGTPIACRELLATVGRPLLSGVIAGGVTIVVQYLYGPHMTPTAGLVVGSLALVGVYVVVLFYAFGQGKLYMSILHDIRASSFSGKALNAA
jgi:PST family polysaccharide transporter